jgi:bla regulator protein blaR1
MNGCRMLMGFVADWSDDALTLAITAGVYAGLLAIVVLVINVAFRRWLSARQMGLLWGIVLLRLLIPVAPSSSFSLEKFARSVRFESIAADEVSDNLDSVPAANAADSPSLASTAEAATSGAISEPQGPRAFDPSIVLERCLTLLPSAWLGGGILYLVATAILYGRLCRRLARIPVCDDQRYRPLWEACCRECKERRTIPVLLFDGVAQPAVSGLFRPRLLLPTAVADLSDQQLRMIMLHELAHVRRWHLAANWLLVVIRAVHWWNPIFWLAASRFQALREQSCDAFAIRRMGAETVRGFSELLLTLAGRQQSAPRWRVRLPASILGFLSSFFRTRAVRNRIKALRSAGVTRGRRQVAGVAALFVLVAYSGLTEASAPTLPTEPVLDWFSRAGNGVAWGSPITPTVVGPNVIRTYEVGKALQRIAADLRAADRAPAELKSQAIFVLQCSTGHYQEATKDPRWPQSVTLAGTKLTVKAPLGAQEEFAKNLSAWEQGGLSQICVGVRFVTLERDIASMAGISWDDLEAFSADREEDMPAEIGTGRPVVRAKVFVDDYVPISVAKLNARQATALEKVVHRDRRASSFYGPKVTLFNGQKGAIFNGAERSFVVGVENDGSGLSRPKIARVNEGVKISFRAIRRGDGKKAQLSGRVALCEIGDVRTASTPLRGKLTTIQVPRVKRCSLDLSSELQEGESLLIAYLPTYEQKRFRYLLLTVHGIWSPRELETQFMQRDRARPGGKT